MRTDRITYINIFASVIIVLYLNFLIAFLIRNEDMWMAKSPPNKKAEINESAYIIVSKKISLVLILNSVPRKKL